MSGRLVRMGALALLAAGSGQDLDRREREPGVDRATDEVADPLGEALGPLVTLVEEGLGEPPERVSGETERKQDQHQFSKRVVRQGREGSLPARRLPAVSERELDRKDAHQREGGALRQQADAGEYLEPPAIAGGLQLALRTPAELLELRRDRQT